MKDKLAKLLTVKSLVTLAVTVVFCYLSIARIISADIFMTVFSVIIAFYYGTQHEKQSTEQKGTSNETTTETKE